MRPGVRTVHERVGRPAPVAAVLLAPALALAGCTGEEPGPAVPTPTAGDGVGAVDAFREQLEALRDLGDAVDQHTAMEEDIAACMAALGFEYTPVDLAAFAPHFRLLRTAHGLDRERHSAWFLMRRA